jgi:hypothetical protein
MMMMVVVVCVHARAHACMCMRSMDDFKGHDKIDWCAHNRLLIFLISRKKSKNKAWTMNV